MQSFNENLDNFIKVFRFIIKAKFKESMKIFLFSFFMVRECWVRNSFDEWALRKPELLEGSVHHYRKIVFTGILKELMIFNHNFPHPITNFLFILSLVNDVHRESKDLEAPKIYALRDIQITQKLFIICVLIFMTLFFSFVLHLRFWFFFFCN